MRYIATRSPNRKPDNIQFQDQRYKHNIHEQKPLYGYCELRNDEKAHIQRVLVSNPHGNNDQERHKEASSCVKRRLVIQDQKLVEEVQITLNVNTIIKAKMNVTFVEWQQLMSCELSLGI